MYFSVNCLDPFFSTIKAFIFEVNLSIRQNVQAESSSRVLAMHVQMACLAFTLCT